MSERKASPKFRGSNSRGFSLNGGMDIADAHLLATNKQADDAADRRRRKKRHGHAKQ